MVTPKWSCVGSFINADRNERRTKKGEKVREKTMKLAGNDRDGQ